MRFLRHRGSPVPRSSPSLFVLATTGPSTPRNEVFGEPRGKVSAEWQLQKNLWSDYGNLMFDADHNIHV